MEDDIYKLIYYPDDKLRVKFTYDNEVRHVTAEHLQIVDKLIRTMQTQQGIGISAPQVGLSISLIAIDDGSGPLAMFNPFITEWLPNKKVAQEGCLSFPKLIKLVERKTSILVRYRDKTNVVQLRQFDGLAARIIQHEIDHLNGILMTDYNHAGRRKG
jgi:peptide deformylase